MPVSETANPGATPGPAATDVSLIRLYALRALFLMMGLFLLSTIAPGLSQPAPTLMTGTARALFTALGLLALLGVRYPLRMLPLMLFEGAWKTIWLAAYGLPLWAAGRLDADSAETFKATAIGVVLVLLVLPWRFLFENYVKQPGDRWR